MPKEFHEVPVAHSLSNSEECVSCRACIGLPNLHHNECGGSEGCLSPFHHPIHRGERGFDWSVRSCDPIQESAETDTKSRPQGAPESRHGHRDGMPKVWSEWAFEEPIVSYFQVLLPHPKEGLRGVLAICGLFNPPRWRSKTQSASTVALSLPQPNRS